MRHNKTINHLGRKSGHRKAMLANMASSLILHKKIKTTEAKAKALKRYVEPLITKSKDDTTHSRRIVFSYLKQKEAVSELFRIIAPAIADRPGGYTRILKLGFRPGDAADVAIIELVDFSIANKAAVSVTEKGETKAAAKPSTRRGRKSSSKKESVEAEVATPATESAETVKKPAATKKAPAKAKTTTAKPAATKKAATKPAAKKEKSE